MPERASDCITCPRNKILVGTLEYGVSSVYMYTERTLVPATFRTFHRYGYLEGILDV